VEELKAAFKSSPLFQKLQKSEGAMNAVKELAEVFQRKGRSLVVWVGTDRV
jgi:hypothetical protein